MPNRSAPWLRLIAIGALLVASYLTASALRPEQHIAAQGPKTAPTSTGTPTVLWHRQIESAGAAVLMSLEEQWPRLNADDYDARLISLGTLESFLNEKDYSRTDDTPVWIVGITTQDSVTLNDIIPGPGVLGATLTWDPVGAYYAWTANDGLLFNVGPLYDEAGAQEAFPKLSDIRALSNDSIPIVTPSPGPTYGAPPDHTPEW